MTTTDNLALLIDFDGTEHRGVFRLYPANDETEDALSLACVKEFQTEFWYGTGFREDLDTKRQAQGDVEMLARKLCRDAGITWHTNY